MNPWDERRIAEPDPGAHAALPTRGEVRLRMKTHPATHGLDGAWWPRSRDPAAEFPDLVLVMSSWVGPVRRVTYAVDDWDAAGQNVAIDGWLVELVGSATLQSHTVLVTGTHQRTRSLLVVPPTAPGAAARAVLMATAGPDAVDSAEKMLTDNGVRLGRSDLHSVDLHSVDLHSVDEM
jgi:hypothetical protein